MSSQPIRSAKALVSGIGVGAALMYYLDPDRGARRRALVRDRLVHAANVASDAAGASSRDLANRARGLVAGARALASPRAAADSVLEARVRTELGRIVSHPGAIDVGVENGRVTLVGDALADEIDDLVGCVGEVRGVTVVENQLMVHESAEGVPSLQGGLSKTGWEAELLHENWTPATRLLTGVAGGVLTLYGARRRDSFGAAVGLAGLALLARGTTNTELKSALGVGGGRNAVEIQKTISVGAPVEDVFAFLTDWESFPQWMSHVREVRSAGEHGGVGERTHWKVDGPAGTTVSWDALTTRFVPNELVAWKSVDGSAIRQAGRIRFSQNDDGGTRVHVQMSYNPPGGTVGHAVAALLGRDPKRQMDDDLARLKTVIETGIRPRDAAQSTVADEGMIGA
jgi:uncharacterized membrane protein